MGWQFVVKPRSELAAKLHELLHELDEGKHADFTIYEESGKLVFRPRDKSTDKMIEKEEKLRIPRWGRN